MLTHFPIRVQPAVAALWSVDEAMGAAIAGASQPALAGIKLAWWREALCRLDTDPAPPEPRLRAVARELLPLGVTGARVSGIEEGWSALLQEQVEASAVALRGERLFAILGTLLNVEDRLLSEAGALFAYSDAMRRGRGDFSSQRNDAIRALASRRVGRQSRPVTLSARLAARDLAEAEGTPARALALLAHRVTGVITGGR